MKQNGKRNRNLKMDKKKNVSNEKEKKNRGKLKRIKKSSETEQKTIFAPMIFFNCQKSPNFKMLKIA